jgi:hypothetical protein
MEVAISIALLFLTPTGCIIAFLIYTDRWLQTVDKEKYLAKSLKKQLKKGNLTELEYFEMLNPELSISKKKETEESKSSNTGGKKDISYEYIEDELIEDELEEAPIPLEDK